ncbi:hypothetical protein KUTeg_008361 [Tegillarca granosa]|uniref:Transcription factor IIIC 90kDa subunit N-terminal domain-containing protein n=1 Tax=Tegillarca granosa TaxID=220873 RepID=A0ABQ9FDU3_TEGGR|nr:hypothetical protein KUTeg_008361 [Tegillarca granosa]
MAGDEKAALGFQQKVSSRNVICWSDDHRLLLCTDGGIHILDMLYSPHQLESTPQFQRQFIPQPQEPCNLTGLTLNKFLKLKDSLDYSELQPVMLDRALCPFVISNCSYQVFKAACWSPLSADVLGRCILSALTYDHRLVLYSSGSSKNQWKQVAELSQLYYNQHEDKLDKKFTSYEKLKSSVYKLSAMEMAWSPLLKDDVDSHSKTYSILAVGMKSGQLVLWKIRFPCLSEADCEITQTFTLSSSFFTSLSWYQTVDSSGTCYIVSGHHDGTIQMASINTKDGTVSDSWCLYSEADLMEVSCICVKSVSENRLCVLGTKETFIMSVLLEVIDKKLKICSVSHTTADNTLYATGLCIKDDQIYMSSIDSVVQKLQLHITNTDAKVRTTPVSIKFVPEASKWGCHGITLSKKWNFSCCFSMLKKCR